MTIAKPRKITWLMTSRHRRTKMTFLSIGPKPLGSEVAMIILI